MGEPTWFFKTSLSQPSSPSHCHDDYVAGILMKTIFMKEACSESGIEWTRRERDNRGTEEVLPSEPKLPSEPSVKWGVRGWRWTWWRWPWQAWWWATPSPASSVSPPRRGRTTQCTATTRRWTSHLPSHVCSTPASHVSCFPKEENIDSAFSMWIQTCTNKVSNYQKVQSSLKYAAPTIFICQTLCHFILVVRRSTCDYCHSRSIIICLTTMTPATRLCGLWNWHCNAVYHQCRLPFTSFVVLTFGDWSGLASNHFQKQEQTRL